MKCPSSTLAQPVVAVRSFLIGWVCSLVVVVVVVDELVFIAVVSLIRLNFISIV